MTTPDTAHAEALKLLIDLRQLTNINGCMIVSKALWIALFLLGFSAGTAVSDNVHFSGLYVPEGLSCEDGAQISKQYGDLRAGYVIYDDEGRKSDDGDCSYAQVQALRGTATQIIDLSCSYDGQSTSYRQLLTPLDDNRMLVINSNDGTTSRFQVYTYCSWVPEN